MAPAADFNCTEEMLRMTFSYINCALQHQGLNRGPWKELERFERDLAKVFEVHVIIDIHFEDKSKRLPTGALVPTGFTKRIFISDDNKTIKSFEFYFKNEDVSGIDWSEFKVN
jgi:DNA/RNA endonuclease G (NUC1)